MKPREGSKRGGVSIDPNVIKVRTHRIKEFLKNLLAQLGKDTRSYKVILNDSIRTARDLFSLRENLTIVEIGLVAFWLNLQKKGRQEFNIKNLIRVSKEELGRNVSAGRILKLISKVNSKEGNIGSLKRLRRILSRLFLNLLRGDFRRKLAEKVDEVFEYTSLIKNEIPKTMEVLGNNKIMIIGHSIKVTGGIIFYILDKIVSKKLGISSVFSAKEIGEVLGVSQYTILRKYKKFLSLLEKEKNEVHMSS
ncbi:MAG: hypothetical protein GWN01_10705 [Nitrosopumilaceae archaeon]|nr:hypothetical protein [Nitrosopumilaceae archaeon]NIU87708.1 hypothetical protein [Nitrosopumilaceae archaeon]NIV66104.1 hypothetical protein [Nitrosopumilaceae archaeon]NIX61964.1 hypothetical protein [Nitrosopumilaceae archaeon]